MTAPVPALFAALREFESKTEPEMRIEQAGAALANSAQLIESLRLDLEQRQRLLAAAKEELDRYSKLAGLAQQEIEPLAELLRGELQRESRKERRFNFAIGLLTGLITGFAIWGITYLLLPR